MLLVLVWLKCSTKKKKKLNKWSGKLPKVLQEPAAIALELRTSVTGVCSVDIKVGCLRIAQVWGEALESQVREGWKVGVQPESCSSGFCWVWHPRAEWKAAATALQFLPVLWTAFQNKKDWGICPELSNSVIRITVNRKHNKVVEQLHLRWRKCLDE